MNCHPLCMGISFESVKKVVDELQSQIDDEDLLAAIRLINRFHRTYDPSCRFTIDQKAAYSLAASTKRMAESRASVAFGGLFGIARASRRGHDPKEAAEVVDSWIKLMKKITKGLEDKQEQGQIGQIAAATDAVRQQWASSRDKYRQGWS